MKITIMNIPGYGSLYFNDLTKHSYNQTGALNFMWYWLLPEAQDYCDKQGWEWEITENEG